MATELRSWNRHIAIELNIFFANRYVVFYPHLHLASPGPGAEIAATPAALVAGGGWRPRLIGPKARLLLHQEQRGRGEPALAPGSGQWQCRGGHQRVNTFTTGAPAQVGSRHLARGAARCCRAAPGYATPSHQRPIIAGRPSVESPASSANGTFLCLIGLSGSSFDRWRLGPLATRQRAE